MVVAAHPCRNLLDGNVRSVLHWIPLRTFAFGASNDRHHRPPGQTRKDEPMVTPMMCQTDVDRSRHSVSSHAAAPTTGGNWRLGSVAPAFDGSTGLSAGVCSTYVTGTNPAGADEQIERPARHLGPRST